MSEKSRMILELKHKFIEDNYVRYRELCSNPFYKKLIRSKMYWEPETLYNEALKNIEYLESDSVSVEDKMFARDEAIINLASILDERLTDDMVLVRK